MEIVIVITMLLFLGFCVLLLGVAISTTYGKQKDETPE